MSAVLDVRGLYVLFGGASRERQHANQGARSLLVDPVTAASLFRPPGYQLGLADLSFTVDGGNCLAVLGTSGSGKSSLLRTLAGLHPAAKGSVLVNGRDVSALPAEQRSVVYLHQEPVLFPHLSVLANVAFPMTIRGVERRTAMRRAADWLARLQVGEVIGNYPDALSGGQRHRVALARALSAEPAVLLLDEPLSSLDPAVRNDVRAALQEVRAASGAAMMLVTHDLDDAMAIASHVSVVGRFGSLSAPLAPAQILEHPPDIDAARLLGVFAELAGTVGDDACFRWIGGSLASPGTPTGNAIACVRSHEVCVQRADASVRDALTVVDRRQSAHDVALVVRNDAGILATIRAGNDTTVLPGDRVRITIDHARFFSAD